VAVLGDSSVSVIEGATADAAAATTTWQTFDYEQRSIPTDSYP